MLRSLTLLLVLTTAMCFVTSGTANSALEKTSEMTDPYLWLEDVSGDKALDWVRSMNKSTAEIEATPGFDKLQERLLKILESKKRIPYVGKYGKYYYNFWRDDKNVRGLWRRTSLQEFKKDEPAGKP